MDQKNIAQPVEDLDILVAKLVNDVLNQEDVKCHIHKEVQAQFMMADSEAVCEECQANFIGQSEQQIVFTPIKTYVEEKNKLFRNLSDRFIDIVSYFQEGFNSEMLYFSLDQRLDIIERDFKKMIDGIRNQKALLVKQVNKEGSQFHYSKYKQYLQNTLIQAENRQFKDFLDVEQIQIFDQISSQLSKSMEKTIGEIKQVSEELIHKEVTRFTNYIENEIRLTQFKPEAQVAQVARPDISRSMFQQQGSQVRSMINSDSEAIGFVIASQRGSRDVLKRMMHQHVETSLYNSNHPKIRVKGGGSFGLSFNNAYGISSKQFDELNLCLICKECTQLNEDMKQTCEKLYEHKYRDGKSWWVEAWFVFLK